MFARITNAFAAANSATMLTMEDMIVSAQYKFYIEFIWGDEVIRTRSLRYRYISGYGLYWAENQVVLFVIYSYHWFNPTAEVNRIMERNNIQFIYKK